MTTARYDGREFPVEDENLTANDFRDVLAQVFPELTGATVRVSQEGGNTFWDYAVVAGQKG